MCTLEKKGNRRKYQLSNGRLDKSKLDKRGTGDGLNLIELYSSRFVLSNLALERIIWNKTETDKIPAAQWEIGQVETGRKGTGAELSWAEQN